MARRPFIPSTQQDLFAPPPRNPGIASPPGAYVGPVSQVTGGPLNAIEAERVIRNVSITWAGAAYEDHRVVCRAHIGALSDSGFYMQVYSGTTDDRVLGLCAVCKSPVIGDPPDVLKRRRRVASSAR